MKPQFQHQVITSFALWLDYVILSKGEAFQNIESSFYHQNDARLDSDFVSFASPHKQWVTDSSIPNAEVIQGITLNGNYIDRNEQDIKYDFNNKEQNIECSCNKGNFGSTFENIPLKNLKTNENIYSKPIYCNCDKKYSYD